MGVRAKAVSRSYTGLFFSRCVVISSILESLEFSSRSDSKNIQSIKVLSFGNEFCEVMAVRVNQEKFRKGIA